MLIQESKSGKTKTIVVTARINMQKIALRYRHAGLADIKNIEWMIPLFSPL